MGWLDLGHGLASVVISTPLLGIGVMVLVYLMDYSLTLRAARLYRAGADQVIEFEGSYELNPQFTGDVDNLRRLSPRFLLTLVAYAALVWAIWFLSVDVINIPAFYSFTLGLILLVQGPVQVRHVRNLVTFRHATSQEGISGRVVYARSFSYKASGAEFLAYAVLYLILGLLTSRWMLIGGAVGCAALARNHYHLSRKAEQPEASN